MSAHDAHYAGELVDGARMLALFGDVATELLIRLDGDEGLFRAYESVEFLAPVFAGDYIEATAELLADGRHPAAGSASRRARSSRTSRRRGLAASAADVLAEPVVVSPRGGHLRRAEGPPAQAARALYARAARRARARRGADRHAASSRPT